MPTRDFTESRTRQNFAKEVKSAGVFQSLHSQTKYRPSSERKSTSNPSIEQTTSKSVDGVCTRLVVRQPGIQERTYSASNSSFLPDPSPRPESSLRMYRGFAA